MDELELFTIALNRTDPAERAAFLDQACAGNPELRQRLEVLLAAHAQSHNPLDLTAEQSDESRQTIIPATAPATGEYRPNDEPGTLAAVDPWSTTDASSGASEPSIEATGELQPDRTKATIEHANFGATTAESKPPAPLKVRDSTGEGIGTVIAGRYKLIDVVGEGGMGSVYLAVQTEPVKRQVALKLIKTGMDSRSVLARFDAERQALALMDHPNIARIYDGGVTPAGQPFFVMELVNGVPLNEYCDRQRLSVKDRLELFVQVCQAVQHAHQKGIIHRDLKPGNVLVTEVDGRPTPKVIDFGVAKATEVKLTDMSFSDVGAIVGTPTYMSPEQADPTSMDIDTRTDVYALGAMLYELLAGSPPIDAAQFKRGAILEMLRMVREVDPPRPSTKLSSAEALPNIAANRSIDPARLSKLLQGELDWVVMKALEKDRTRRYETANGFARDIQRYLADEVVEARPPSRGYRVKKFVKRNKLQVTAASLVFLSLVAGVIGTTWQMSEANLARAEEKKRADGERAAKIDAQRARDAESEERAKAVVQRDKAIAAERKTKTINDFLMQDLLKQAEPGNNAVENKVTLLEVVDRAAAKVGARFADQPELEQTLRMTIANTYHGLASWEKAEAQWRACFEAARKLDPKSAETYTAQGGLAHILEHRGQRGPEILKMAEEAAKGLQSTLGPVDLTTQGMLCHLAVTYQSAGKFDEAIAVLEPLRDIQLAKLGPKNSETLRTLSILASSYFQSGKATQGIALFERIRDDQIEVLGAEHPDTLTTCSSLSAAYAATGRLTEAIPLMERIRDIQIAKLGPNHTETLATLHNLAGANYLAGRIPEAIALFERVRDACVATLGPDHTMTLDSIGGLAMAYIKIGKFEAAVALLEPIRDSLVAKLGPEHPQTLRTLDGLGMAYYEVKQHDKATPLMEDTLKRRENLLGRQHPESLMAMTNLGANYRESGRFKESIALLEEAYRRTKSDPMVANQLMEAYRRAREDDKLAGMLSEQLVQARKTLPKESPQLGSMLASISLALLNLKKSTEAEPLLREALAIREKSQPDLWSTFNTMSLLGGALLGQKKYSEAEPLLLKGYEGMKAREKTIPPMANTRIPEAIDRLIELYTATKKTDEVKKWQVERAKYPQPKPKAEK